jgi:hypothetical protein
MKQYADIIAFDKNGQVALIAEVKNKRGTSKEWATRLRRNLYASALRPHAPFCLLALPDKFYLWKNMGGNSEVLEPTQEIDPRPFLQTYYEKSGVSPNSLTGDSFELIITSWLNQVLSARSPQELLNGNQDWLISSGLFDKLAGGHLELEVAA